MTVSKQNAQALLDAATPGEWVWSKDEDHLLQTLDANGENVLWSNSNSTGYDWIEVSKVGNAALIEAAKPYLQAYIEQCDVVARLEARDSEHKAVFFPPLEKAHDYVKEYLPITSLGASVLETVIADAIKQRGVVTDLQAKLAAVQCRCDRCGDLMTPELKDMGSGMCPRCFRGTEDNWQCITRLSASEKALKEQLAERELTCTTLQKAANASAEQVAALSKELEWQKGELSYAVHALDAEEKLTERLVEVLEFYGNVNNHDQTMEIDGNSFKFEPSICFKDQGKKAREALAAVEGK